MYLMIFFQLFYQFIAVLLHATDGRWIFMRDN